ncbi:MAG: ArsR/SmtB family transcription factor [Balneola sp.]
MLDSTFHALADSTRRSILLRLSEQELTVNEIAEPYEMSLAAVSKHLKVLEKSELIKKEKVGRSYTCTMNYAPLNEVQDLINEYKVFWEARLDELDKFITQTKKD